MSKSINDIKLAYFQKRSQVVVFNKSGGLVESCDTLFNVDAGQSVLDQFIFLEGLAPVLQELKEGQTLDFPLVEWTDQKDLLLELHFEAVGKNSIQWFSIDKTFERDTILQVQQQRNQSAINEEFLTIQKRYLEVEKELLDFKNEELERIQSFKSKFFAEVSHEMRTPLNSMAGLIDLLQNKLQDASQREYLENLKATSNHLRSIINDVLDLSKAEAGKLRLEESTFNLKELIQTTLFGLKLQAEEKALQFEVDMSQIKHAFLIGDEIRLAQVIYNLVGNAVKYTLKGKVNITLRERNVETDNALLEFEIADTGKGMSQQDITNILEPYGQASGQNQQDFEGTGLGMGIAKQLIELMGGELKIESEPNVGTTISFSIKLKPSDEVIVEETVPIPSLSNQQLLLVEDDVLSRNVLYEYLKRTGAQIKMVDHIDDVLVILSKHTFDGVISDVNIVGGSTLPLFKEYSGRLLFVSGDVLEQECIKVNYPEAKFLLKPVSKDDLYISLSASEEEADASTFTIDNLRRASQDDEVLIQLMIDTIAESLPKELVNLMETAANKDSPQCKHILHKIKPSIVYLGNQALMDMRTELHDVALKGSIDLDQMASFIKRVEAGLAKFLAMYKH